MIRSISTESQNSLAVSLGSSDLYASVPTSDLIGDFQRKRQEEVIEEFYSRLPKLEKDKFEAKEKLDQIKRNIKLIDKLSNQDLTLSATIDQIAQSSFETLNAAARSLGNHQAQKDLSASTATTISTLENTLTMSARDVSRSPIDAIVSLCQSLYRHDILETIAEKISIEIPPETAPSRRQQVTIEKFLRFLEKKDIIHKFNDPRHFIVKNFIDLCLKNNTLWHLDLIMQLKPKEYHSIIPKMAKQILQDPSTNKLQVVECFINACRKTNSFKLLKHTATSVANKEEIHAIESVYQQSVAERKKILEAIPEPNAKSLLTDHLIQANHLLLEDLYILLKSQREHKTHHFRDFIMVAATIACIGSCFFFPIIGCAVAIPLYLSLVFLLYRTTEEQRAEKIAAGIGILSGKKAYYQRIFKEFASNHKSMSREEAIGLYGKENSVFIDRIRNIKMKNTKIQNHTFKELETIYNELLSRFLSSDTFFDTLLSNNKLPRELSLKLVNDEAFLLELFSSDQRTRKLLSNVEDFFEKDVFISEINRLYPIEIC